ncbi:MAG: prepilin peptidase [Verrucomicrobia bacterium]|nr:prepilin peptidase [Verrucomicrobiota bacterium]
MTFIEVYYAFVTLVLGLCFGSFLNVCIYRIPAEISLSHPPSTCPKCKTRIKWYDNVPVFGWIALGGKCRNCKLPISVGYPLIELTTGLFFLTLYLIYGFSWLTPIYALAVFGLLLGTFIDLAEMWLPDRVTIGGMILYPILSALVPELHGVEGWLNGLIASLIGLAVGFGLFWGIGKLGTAIFKKDAMGFGDVKLMGGLGALFGWQAVLFILFFSALAGSVIGVGLIAMKKKELSSQIPYGPYLALAAFAWVLGGYRLWDAYLAFMGF